MYNWMKWLRLLGGWHFIAATAIKPPKAACQFAADDILLYKICYNIQWIYFTIWEKGKEELSPLQYHFKSLHIISRHYKKSLLRSQIYHGYEELSTDTNYPIWRRQKLPYMKKTRKKKQVCGAACFMAAEIKFSEEVRDRQLLVRTSNFLNISLQIDVWISQNSDQDRQLFQLSPEHCSKSWWDLLMYNFQKMLSYRSPRWTFFKMISFAALCSIGIPPFSNRYLKCLTH